jgi:hypothetical protein
MSKQLYTVAWSMKEDKILKLVETDKSYDVSDKVDTYLKGQDLYDKLDDKKVEVEIDESKIQKDMDKHGGEITHLKLADGHSKSNPKSETKKEIDTNTPVDGIVKELTVHGVSVAKSGVKFKEDDNWFTLDKSIDAKTFKEECTKKKVQVTIVNAERGNDVVTSYIVCEDNIPEENKEEPKEQVKKNSYTNDVQKSIEAQASVNSANEVVSHMIEILLDPQKVLSTITKIAEHNFSVIQSLKNKE